jgi:hypothetical protein
MQKPILNLMIGLLLLFTAVVGSAHAAGGPSQDEVRKFITKMEDPPGIYKPGEVQIQFHSIQIAAGRKILNQDAGRHSIPPGTIIYPVPAKYTRSAPMGTTRIVRERTQYYYFYKDEFGNWGGQMIANPQNSTVEH